MPTPDSLSELRPGEKTQLCQRLIMQGQCARQKRNHRRAAWLFGAALDIAAQVPAAGQEAHNSQHIENILASLITAYQSLAVELCARDSWKEAAELMSDLHRKTVDLCQDTSLARDIRLDALGCLDKTLMLLTTLLGWLGRSEQMHGVIEKTGRVVEEIERELFGG